jgi:hypothetical protein
LSLAAICRSPSDRAADTRASPGDAEASA